MKRILITGANSYIGTSFEKWVTQWPKEYFVDNVDTKNGEWKEIDFSIYDVILHVAGIAHIKETKENQHLYYLVNRDLAIEVANKALSEGVKQFVLLSSMSVYGLEKGIINNETPLAPKNAYGQSKLEAELAIEKMNSDDFTVTIIRPPMIYGKGCKGNYQTISKFAKKTPVFPTLNSKRSMIYIDNLSEYMRYLIDYNQSGVYCPQNTEFTNIHDLVKTVADSSNNKIKFIGILNPFVHLLSNRLNNSVVSKVFGDLIYDKDSFSLSGFNENAEYTKIPFEETIRLTEAQVVNYEK
jgi:UDP-glucose 4-epimerase